MPEASLNLLFMKEQKRKSSVIKFRNISIQINPTFRMKIPKVELNILICREFTSLPKYR